MNFIHYWWPSLLNFDGFIKSMATPIVKAWKKTDKKMTNVLKFYTLTDYENWKKETNMAKWETKYYKGLGTHDDKEAKECFCDFASKIINYVYTNPKANSVDNQIIPEDVNNNNSNNNPNNDPNNPNDNNDIKSTDSKESKNTSQSAQEGGCEIKDDTNEDVYMDDKTNENYIAITLGFAKNKVIDRKRWLEKYDRNNIIDYNTKTISYHDFINKDLIHFSNYDNYRSIPSMKDGFKPSLRKIIYVCFKKDLATKALKVAQLSGFVSAEAAYHHGETSLQGAIVGMAQDFVGSNNLNLLLPKGNYGNRREGGKNAASARYICTKLHDLTPLIYRREDEHVYNYVDDDGLQAEPVTYAPIIPMILVNGTQGIGTGFSTFVPCYNPKDLIKNVRKILNNKSPDILTPWYKGFTGTIKKEIIKDRNGNIKDNDGEKYKTFGIYENLDKTTMRITELPIGVWTDDYFKFLDSITRIDPKKPMKTDMIQSWDHSCGTNTIDITIVFLPGILQDLIKKNELVKKMKLSKSIKTSNMHLYDLNDTIKKYESIDEIINDYIKNRLIVYDKRKQFHMRHIKNQLEILKWKVTFLEYVTHQMKIEIFSERNGKRIPLKEAQILDQLITCEFPKLSNNVDAEEADKTYNYITNMKLWSLTEEEMDSLIKEKLDKEREYDIYYNTSINVMWLRELDELEKAYDKVCAEEQDQNKDKNHPDKKTKKSRAKKQ